MKSILKLRNKNLLIKSRITYRVNANIELNVKLKVQFSHWQYS